MHHHLPKVRVAGLVAILAALVLAPAVPAASPSKASGAGSAKERAYGKHCGPKKAKDRRQSSARAKCLNAMAKLDKGSTTSPTKACRGLSRKRAKGERKSAFARCVSEGARLQADKHGEDEGDDDGGDPGLDEADDDDDDSDLDEGDEGDVDADGDGATDDDDDD